MIYKFISEKEYSFQNIRIIITRMKKIHKKKLIKKTKMEINKSIFLKTNLGVKKIYS